MTARRFVGAALLGAVALGILCRNAAPPVPPSLAVSTGKPDIYGSAPAADVQVYTTPAAFTHASGAPLPPYGEAPELADRVARGELPPVAARLPEAPLVVRPYESVGRYGGTLRVDAYQWRGYLHHGLFRRNSEGDEIIPDLSEGYAYSADYRSLTIHLRRGMRWSDGAPFTVEDILFVWEDEIWNPALTPVPPYSDKDRPQYVAVDDYTLRIDFSRPRPDWMAAMSHPFSLSQGVFFNPKHHLKRWHAAYNPDADELARSEGFGDWTQAYTFHAAKLKLEERPGLPTLNPWVVTAFNSSYGMAERNPYFSQVDTHGNQLPYIDRILALRTKADQTQAKIMQMLGGELDHLPGFSELSVDEYPFLKESEAIGGYRIVAFPSSMMSAMTLSLNPLVPDPVLRPIFNDIRFRQALSLAIDRDAINEMVYLGLGEPRQETPLPLVSFSRPEWGSYLTEYDPDRANALLDDAGLAWDRRRRVRLRPDGRPLDLLIESGHGSQIEAYVQELLAGQFSRVGVKLTMESEKMSHHRLQEDLFELLVCDNGGPAMELCFAGGEPYFLNQGYGWNRWLTQWIEAGEPPERIQVGVEPPEEWKRLALWIDEARTLPAGSPEWVDLKQRIWDFRSQSLWHIGTVYRVPIFDLVGARVRNFPKLPWYGWSTGAHVMTHPEQWYLETPRP